MLPEKKQNLIIAGISIFIVIAIVLIIAAISNFIKNKDNKERKDLPYITEYEYIGVLKNEDGFYEIYGINDTEESLNIKTLYEIKDIRNINNHIVFFSDATNIVKYDGKEFYLNELNTYYTNNNVYLSEDYIIISSDKSISYFKYEQEYTEAVTITDNLKDKNILVKDNIVYYVLETGIYKYDLINKLEEIVLETNENYVLSNIDNSHLYLKLNNELITYNINLGSSIKFSSLAAAATFIDVTEDGFIYVDNENTNVLKEYGWDRYLSNNYDISSSVVKSKIIDTNIYYMTLSDKSNVLIDIDKKETKILENNYLYIMKVKYEN